MNILQLQELLAAEQALADLYPNFLAWDLEADCGFERPDLLTLSTGDTLYLLQLTLMQGIPQHLLRIFSNPRIIKVGCGNVNDLECLTRHGFKCQGMLDIQILAQIKGLPIALDDLYLKEFPEQQPLLPVSHKSIKWSHELSQDLIDYALADVQAIRRLTEKFLQLPLSPPYQRQSPHRLSLQVPEVKENYYVEYLTFVKQSLSTGPRDLVTLVNQTINSFKCSGSPETKRRFAEHFLYLFATEQEIFCVPILELFSSTSIHVIENTIQLQPKELQLIWNVSIRAAENQLANAAPSFQKFPEPEKRAYIRGALIHYLETAGRLKGGKIFPHEAR